MSFSIEQIPAEATLRLRRDILYPDATIKSVLLDEDDKGLHYGLFYEGKLAGVVSLFDSGNGSWQFRKLAISTELQGKKLGSAILNHLIEETKRLGGNRLWCNARLSATGFYKKHGFTTLGDEFEKGGIGYVVMERGLG